MAFEPSIGRAATQDGINASRAPYADGSAGTRQSLDAMAQKMREGRLDPAMKEWAVSCLRAKGIDGRDNVPIRRQVQALLDCLRDQAIYVPDAYGAEVVQSGAATLCLRPNLCIRGGDCDDLSVALGSATLSIGIPTAIVKQSYGAEHQEHVLIACYDEGGSWFYADPSTNWPVGRAANALDEVWIDPLGQIGNLPESHAEIVTMGKPRYCGRCARSITHDVRGGDGMMHNHACPSLGRPLTLGAAAASTWTLVTDGTVHAGSRYRMGVLLNLQAMGVTSLTVAQVTTFFSQDWVVESATATGDVTGGVQSWVVQGVAKTEGTIVNTDKVTTSALAIETPAPASSTTAAPSPSASDVSVGKVAVIALVAAVIGGVIYATRNER